MARHGERPHGVSARILQGNRENSLMKAIALYLPQFHPIPENDEWWGPGFTEWTNVVNAVPLFRGHYQPHLPADLGFYDLRVPESRQAQASLAEAHGISAFCYYHYWFNGRRLLERPFDAVLLSGAPKLPFCLCWANESWTRRWDGNEDHRLIQQTYSVEDDVRHVEYLLRVFSDDRYIKIHDRPLFLVYRTDQLPDPAKTARIWRDRARAGGFRGLYLVSVESRPDRTLPPEAIGFDATLEFAPDFSSLREVVDGRWNARVRLRRRLMRCKFDHSVSCYERLVDRALATPRVGYVRFRCVTPGWDNSPRRRRGARILVGSTPQLYENWLRTIVDVTRAEDREGEETLVFINAWNEWAEGNHLEPDQRWGRAYLEATARALS
jgi:lipopolysaccharide biosynthesis protein